MNSGRAARAAAAAREQRPVLVVGAGPSGLMAAVELARRGVPVRCVDRAEGPSPLSKALGVWPRTLELLDRLGGLAHRSAHGLPQSGMRYYSRGRVIADIRFRPEVRPSVLPQPDVEEVIRTAFEGYGGWVEWGTELLHLEQDEGGVKALMRDAVGTERREEFAYVVGADGASSRVRDLLGIPFEGATYPIPFVVADIHLDTSLDHDVTHYFCSDKGILVACGLPSGRWRVFTSGPPGLQRDQVDLATVQALVDERGPGGLTLRDPDWVSVFSVHARHAERTRSGRVFLVGDAAHIHSPAGGQGLNTGVADAHNLAWRLALVWHRQVDADVLDAYEEERGQVARAVVRQAGTQTRLWMLTKPSQKLARDTAVRTASALRLQDLAYLPWLAGLRTVYASVPGSGRPPLVRHDRMTLGALVPGATVWDDVAHRRIPLRSALSDLRHTLLVSGAGGVRRETLDLLEWAGRELEDVLDVRLLDVRRDRLSVAGVVPRLRDGGRGGVRLSLVRPDNYVALHVAEADHAAVRAELSRLFRPVVAGTWHHRTTDS
ncbi:FAD-dependent monooxygenase [Streptomyces cellulosae]|uniref:FAD-dependent monooxygenase n=1 Tax=Streptomyces cellulosae TaxID=1968 RepID=UPI0007C7CF65|nr:FAD-dependent monooxygenase [Streptomyces cellulosae]